MPEGNGRFMQTDRQIALWGGWIAGPAFGVAMMAAPDYLHLKPVLAATCFWGGIIVFIATVFVVAALQSREREQGHKPMWPIFTMAAGMIVFGVGAAGYFWPAASSDKPSAGAEVQNPKATDSPVAESSGLRISISDVIFDPNGPTEYYVEFRLSNVGPPTTIEGWNLSIFKNGNILQDGQPPRVTFSPTYNPSTNRLDPPKDLSTQPIQTGEQIRPRFTWTFKGNPKNNLAAPAHVFI
jgi:hypothetical protein